MTPYWNTKDNWSKTNQIKANKDKYCINCNKPMTTKAHIYCSSCHSLLMNKGLELERVKIGTIYKDTINYQQYLYRSIFKCNAPLQARGLKENRIKCKVKQDILDKTLARIHNLIVSQDNRHKTIYLSLDYPRLLNHILYRVMLFHISYYVNNNPIFKSEAHFYASLVSIYYTTIERFYIRRTKTTLPMIHQDRTHYKNKDKYHIVDVLSSCFAGCWG